MKHKGDGGGKRVAMDGKKNFRKREYLNHKFKNNFGTRQEGHGLALLQKKKVMLRYNRDSKREEQRFKKQNEHRLLTKGGLQIAESDLEAMKDFPLFNQEEKTNNNNNKNDDEVNTYSVKPRKLSKFQKASAEYQRKKEEKEIKIKEAAERKIVIEDAKNNYQKKRLERYKKLNQRTKKGQPVMKGRIELMLQKLQDDMKFNK